MRIEDTRNESILSGHTVTVFPTSVPLSPAQIFEANHHNEQYPTCRLGEKHLIVHSQKEELSYMHKYTFFINGLKTVAGYDGVKVHSEEETLALLDDAHNISEEAFIAKHSANSIKGIIEA